MTVDISRVLSQTKTQLETVAATKFGAAVEDFTRNTVGSILGNPNTSISSTRDPSAPPSRPTGALFVPSSYAAALAGGTSYRPKLKFLFKVEFVFTPQAVSEFPDLFGGAAANDFTFMVKAVDRPKIDFEYEDDVNMYNYRTKVLKKIRHRELTITFLDDAGNRVINFFRGLMMLNSPITRRQLLREGTTNAPDPNSTLGGTGMTFSTDATDITIPDNAVRGVVNSQVGNVIQTIRVKQIYIDPLQAPQSATMETIYDFINARIVSFDLDDLSYETSEASTMTMQFDYDWMEIVNTGALAVMDGPNYAIAVPGSTAPVDLTVQKSNGQTTSKADDPFSRIIAGAFSNTVSKLTSEGVNRAVQAIAGKGIFGQIIGQQASNAVSGIVGLAARNIAMGASQQISPAISSTLSNIVQDSAAGAQRAVGVVRSGVSSVGSFLSNLSL